MPIHIVDPGSSNELQTRFFVVVKQCDTYGFVQAPLIHLLVGD